MITNNQNMYETQPQSIKAKSGPAFQRRNSAAACLQPLQDASNQQARDPECQSMPDPMDVSVREASRPFLTELNPRSYPHTSIQTLCYKLDLGSSMPERLPRIDYSSRRGSSKNMAIQTSQIFRGVVLGEDGTVLQEGGRATKSNAGKGPRTGKRSRQAASIHQARYRADASVKDGNTSKCVSLVVLDKCHDLQDLIDYSEKKKLQKLETERPEDSIPGAFHAPPILMQPLRELPPIV